MTTSRGLVSGSCTTISAVPAGLAWLVADFVPRAGRRVPRRVGKDTGSALPVFASATVSDLRKSLTLSSGTSIASAPPVTRAFRSKYAMPLR